MSDTPSGKFDQIRERARKLDQTICSVQHSAEYAAVVGVLSGLGFIVAPGFAPRPSSKVDLSIAISIGTIAEPRILEVLPAAVLSFPRSFSHVERAPASFHEVLRALRRGTPGPEFEGIPFEKVRQAAERPVRNRRRKILSERRVSRTFRLSPGTIRTLSERAKKLGKDHTAYIELLIKRDAAAAPER